MIDSHCHLNASYTPETVVPIITHFAEQGGKYIVDVSTTLSELTISQQIINKYPRIVFATAGIHPELCDGTTETFTKLKQEVEGIDKLAPSLQNLVGIGETGIDINYITKLSDEEKKSIIEQQRELFVLQIGIAQRYSLPLVIHARGSSYEDASVYTEIIEILKQEKFSQRVYFHSFAGDYELAKQVVDEGNVIGINGIVTYSNAKRLAEIAEKIPLDSVLLETDAPFLIPSNLDRSLLIDRSVNEPLGIFATAKRIANLRHCPEQEVLEKTCAATRSFFAKIL